MIAWIARCCGFVVLSICLWHPVESRATLFRAFLGGFYDGSACDQAIQAYVSTHPHAVWTGNVYALDYNTLKGAVSAMKAAPCGDFDRIQLLMRFMNGLALQNNYKPPDLPIGHSENGHQYTAGSNGPVRYGSYMERIEAACNDWGAVVGFGARLVLEYVPGAGGDWWRCIWGTPQNGHGVNIIPICRVWYRYVLPAGAPDVPQAGTCTWRNDPWVTAYPPLIDAHKPAPSCPGVPGTCAGNPIDVGRSSKTQREIDFADPQGLLSVERHYSSDGVGGPQRLWEFNWRRRAVLTKLSGNVASADFVRPDYARFCFAASTLIRRRLSPMRM